jgi:hypothetical protein
LTEQGGIGKAREWDWDEARISGMNTDWIEGLREAGDVEGVLTLGDRSEVVLLVNSRPGR